LTNLLTPEGRFPAQNKAFRVGIISVLLTRLIRQNLQWVVGIDLLQIKKNAAG
jgi:hypothetical protein